MRIQCSRHRFGSMFLLIVVFVFPLPHMFSTCVLSFCVCLLVIVAAPSCTMTQSVLTRLHPDHFLPFLAIPLSYLFRLFKLFHHTYFYAR